MSFKHPALPSVCYIESKDRKSFGLETKMKIVLHHEGGEGANSISRARGPAQSTVSTVIKKANEVKEAGKYSNTLMAKTTSKSQEPLMENMERPLKMWIEYQTRCCMPLSTALVCTKALSSLWNDLKKDIQVDEEVAFKPSKDWFERFKTSVHMALHNIKMIGKADSSDKPAADAFKPVLKKRIEDGGYSSKQVTNVDETSL